MNINRPAESKPNYFPALTGLRAIAVYFIFFHHFNPPFISKSTYVFHLVNELYLGVTIFFVLSGFLITYHYYPRYLARKHWFKHFLINRFAKTYPLFALISFLQLRHYHAQFIFWLVNFTLIKGYFSDFIFTGAAAAWILTVEWTFYLLIPLIFRFLAKFSLITQTLFYLSLGVIGVSLGRLFDWYGFFNTPTFMLAYTFFGRSFEFLLGAYTAIKLIGSSQISLPRRLTLKSLIWMILILLVQTQLRFPAYGGIALLHPLGFFVNLFLALSIIGLIIGLAYETTIFQTFLATPLMIKAGQASYAFFLLHFTYISDQIYQFVNYRYWLFFISLNLISYWLYQYLELPLSQKTTQLFHLARS